MATKAKPVPEKLTVLERLQKLDADKAKLDETRKGLLDRAKEELLSKGRALVAELSTLGFAYSFTDARPKKSHKKQTLITEKTTRHKPQGLCPICGWQTEPPHDKRSHRHQTKKIPFSAEELARRGLTRVP